MDVKVEVLKYPTEEDWMLCKQITLTTVSKEATTPPSEEWKVKILEARHSPIRTLNFCFKISNLPTWVATHLIRHVHAIPFVSSQRNDRQDKYDRNAARQDAPVTMCWYMNAEEFMVICNKRLCRLASPETRSVIELICQEVFKTNPEFISSAVPYCYYRGGRCTEMKSCGFNHTYAKAVDESNGRYFITEGDCTG